MRKLMVFNQTSLDGFFADTHSDMSWLHRPHSDPEFDAFVQGNARGDAVLLFGRVTYDLMTVFWPTPIAMQVNPIVAERMNALPKIVVSRTLSEATWNNTTILSGDLPAEIRRLKGEPGDDICIIGSGSIVVQLANAGLIDHYQIVVNPIVLGAGRNFFAGLQERLSLTLTASRTFANGNVVLDYEPA